ncbi:fungal-specific transcription factor domain-containing protein [Xylaria nigripes]|nr:fungal-specific transcription factor domain-containing protein [Xylaria nigripes]
MSSTPGSAKAPRVLACVLCQNRKIKCDRNTPCSNCGRTSLKYVAQANVRCVPSTPAPPRKRRRPNQDLQQRLARCEELLSKYTANPPNLSNESQGHDEHWRPRGKLVIDNHGTRFTDSELWATVHHELSAMREIVEDDERNEDYYSPADSQTPEHNMTLLLSDGSDKNPEYYRPSPAHAFFLWHIFLERVNPLTKVIHVPSLQPKLVEATTDPSSIPKNIDALLFSIYALAITALNEKECQQQLGCAKEEAHHRFSTGCRIALMRTGVLTTYDLVVLQALVLYLFSLAGRVDRHACWILNGVAIRVAQKMGLHRDGELLGLPPFETEMRRRIWWQIILIDALYALMSGLGQSLLPRFWNTKRPCNIHDADLYPTMTTLQPREGPTDMIYCLVCYEVATMVADSPSIETVFLGNETGISNIVPSEVVEKARRRINELDQSISIILDKYCDRSMGPIHDLAAGMRHTLISKCWELARPMTDQPEWGTEIRNPGDNLFKIAMVNLESDLEFYRTVRTEGPFLWFLLTNFQIEMLIYIAGQLTGRTAGNLVERAWAVIEAQYEFHDELGTLSSKKHIALAILVVRGWKAREAWLQKTMGCLPPTPRYIVKLQDLVPSTDTKQMRADESGSAANTTNINAASNDPASASGNLTMPWDQMLSYTDAGAFDWEIFSGNIDSLGMASMPGGTSFVGQQDGSWME